MVEGRIVWTFEIWERAIAFSVGFSDFCQKEKNAQVGAPWARAMQHNPQDFTWQDSCALTGRIRLYWVAGLVY